MSDNKTIDIQKIMKILPHRYPFLLVDRVIEYEPKKRAVAIKNVTLNEPQFMGHFPNYPIMPGVLIVEAMVQTGAILLLQEPEASGKLVFFAGIENVRFKRPVVPGDQMRMEVESVWVKRGMGRIKGVTTVDGNVVAEGEFTFSLAPASVTGSDVHATANVHPKAELGKNVVIGPFVTIAPDVVIGDGTEIGANSVIKDGVRIGKGNKIGEGVVLGAPPQDVKYQGEKSFVNIGDNNLIREYVTIHAATGEGAATVIGNNNFLMAYVHIGHNCIVGNDVTITIQAAIGGHCVLEDQSVIGGLSALHQFIRVGKLAMIGGVSRVIQDIPPYMMAVGNPSLIRGVNSVGISRRGGSSASLSEIKNAYKLLYRSGLNFSQAVEKLGKEVKTPEGKHLLAFLEAPSLRGILKKAGTEEEGEES